MIPEYLTRVAWRGHPADALKPITYRSRVPANQATFLGYTVFRALKRDLTFDERMAHQDLLGKAAWAWEIWAEALENAVAIAPATLPVPNPKAGDEIVDGAGVTYVVRERSYTMYPDPLVLVCVQTVG